MGLLGLTLGLAVLGFLPAALGCGSRPEAQHRPITIAGSTSVQPFAERLAEVYMAQNPGVVINVQGGGSSAGIQAVRQGAADLGASSRELLPEEKDLVEIPIAWDGIALVVHPANPLTNLSLDEIRRIFVGTLQGWQELGLEPPGRPEPAHRTAKTMAFKLPHPIHAITREEGSGTREAFEQGVMARQEITPGALVQDSNGAVREIVASDLYALGYISQGLVDETVKAVAVEGIHPNPETIKSRQYKLARRFLLVARTPPTGRVKDFVDFILSPKGQQLLEAEGLVGVQ